jgi:hypothetical protein
MNATTSSTRVSRGRRPAGSRGPSAFVLPATPLAACLALLFGAWDAGAVRGRAAAGSAPAIDAAGVREALPAQDAPAVDPLHAPLEEVLDLNVRDGLVYYRALQGQRGRLDRYIASLNVPAPAFDAWDRDRRAALWLNAYNALVLRTVIDHYPIRGRSGAYPSNSIRQIPGAFDRTTWRIAGRAVTLDAIETTHLSAFRDPRMFFAIGRGAVDGGRLRSEAFTAARLERQLTDAIDDCVRRVTCAQVEAAAGVLRISPIFSWREAEFAAAFAGAGQGKYPGRTPIEAAAVALIEPHLYPSEREWLAQNRFKVEYKKFDWRLNDLTGGGPQ